MNHLMSHHPHYVHLSVTQLKPDPEVQSLYPEQTPEQLDHLTEHIKKCGILTPLIVKPHDTHFLIVDGATRHAIAQELGIPAVPCFICENELHVLAATFLNLHRRHLSPETQEQLRRLERTAAQQLKPHLDEALLNILDQFPIHTIPHFNDSTHWWTLGIGSQTLQTQVASNLQGLLQDYTRQHQALGASDPKLLSDRNRLAKKVTEYQDTIADLRDQLATLQEQLEQRDATLATWTAPDRLGSPPASPTPDDPPLVNRFLRLNLHTIEHALETIEAYFTQEHAGQIDADIWQQLGAIEKRFHGLLAKGQRLPAELKLRLIQGQPTEAT